jgi:hypothetical protein
MGAKAVAGPDRGAHAGVTVTLDGSQSLLPPGVTYDWVQTVGPEVPLSTEMKASEQLSFAAPSAPSELVFVLRLKGAMGGLTAADSVVVTVRPDEDNGAPSGEIEATGIGVGGASFQLRAAVEDPDSDPFTCTWSGTNAAFNPTVGRDVTVTLSQAVGSVTARCCDAANACVDVTRALP